MNRRLFAGWLAASGLTSVFAIARPERDQALAHTFTPVPPFDGGTCNLELDFADLTLQIEIPEEIGWEQYDLIVSIISARIHRLGWTGCSVSRYDREILVNVQVEQGANLDLSLIGELLITPGRVDLIDPGEAALEIGETVTTSTTPLDPEGPEINVVYTSVLSNLDIVAIEHYADDSGENGALIQVHETVIERIVDFAGDNVGAPIPLVLDGVVTLTPVVQDQIEAEFILLPVEAALVERLRTYGAIPPLPGPLTLTAIRDNRATPTASLFDSQPPNRPGGTTGRPNRGAA